MTNKYAIGIDFGTTTSRIIVQYTDKWEPLPQAWPLKTIVLPNSDEDCFWVGEEAEKRGKTKFPLLKLKMNEKIINIEDVKNPVKELSYLPEVLTACIIHRLVENASDTNPGLTNTKNVTITIPALSSERRRQKTWIAARLANFDNVRFLPEPVAAYIYFAYLSQFKDWLKRKENILVFDFGGGTCDVSIVQKKEGDIPTVIGLCRKNIGGEDFDEYLAQKRYPGLWANIDYRLILKKTIKHLKETLNDTNLEKECIGKAFSKQIILPDNTSLGELWMEKDFLDNMVKEKLKNDIENTIKGAIDDCLKRGANLSKKDIEGVIMVGGSSYLREVQNIIETYFVSSGLVLNRKVESKTKGIILHKPEEAVVNGAAYFEWSKYQSKKKLIRLPLSMKYWLKFDDKKSDFHTREELGHPGKDTLPTRKKRFRIALPSNKREQELSILQENEETGEEEIATLKIKKIRKFKPYLHIKSHFDENERIHIKARLNGKLKRFKDEKLHYTDEWSKKQEQETRIKIIKKCPD